MREHLPILMALVPLAGAWLLFSTGFFSFRSSRWIPYLSLLAGLVAAWEAFPRLL